MQTQEYQPLGTEWINDKKVECCKPDDGDTPPGCDCCYNTWASELEQVNSDMNRLREEAFQMDEQYNFLTGRRDKFKFWFDDLVRTDQLATVICDEFEVILSQTEKICTNSHKTVEAINILFCMIRDFYMQLDYLQTRYTDLTNCISCLNSSDLPETSGIRKCLSMYNDKLQAVITTRTDIMQAIMLAIKSANLLHFNICYPYGLQRIVVMWHERLCGGIQNNPGQKHCGEEQKKDDQTICVLAPILSFPIRNDPYYKWVEDHYQQDRDDAITLSQERVKINKRKEALAACQTSLIAAIKEVDPKELCK